MIQRKTQWCGVGMGERSSIRVLLAPRDVRWSLLLVGPTSQREEILQMRECVSMSVCGSVYMDHGRGVQRKALLLAEVC
jgi:hypothetical protein